MESEIIATLPVMAPPINSKIEKDRFSKKAIKIFFCVFIRNAPLFYVLSDCLIVVIVIY